VDAVYLSAEFKRQAGRFDEAAVHLKLLRETPNDLDPDNQAGLLDFVAKVQKNIDARNADPMADAMMAR
jgi:hypothetical protein